MGHSNVHHNNMYYNSHTCLHICAQAPGFEDGFFNNTCVIHAASPSYGSFSPGIGGTAWPEMHDNRVYTIDGKATLSGKSIASWNAMGVDLRTTVATIPSDAQLVAAAKVILGM